MAQQLSPLEKFLSGKFANEIEYGIRQVQKGKLPYNLENFGLQNAFKPPGSNLNAIQTGKYGPTDWNPRANPLATSAAPAAPNLPAAARAEQQERSRIAQMTEQDPLFKKYKVADLTKAYNTATDPKEKERIGLEIWATSNPQLAAKLKPGQSGYQQVASVLGTQTFGTNQPGITQAAMTEFAEKVGAPGMVQTPEGFGAAYTTPTANFGAGVNAQQLAYSPVGEVPPAMIGAEVFNQQGPFNVPKELLDQKTMSLLRQALASRIK